jgi:hypothetical protein
MRPLDYDALHTAYTEQITNEIKNSAGNYRPFLTTTTFKYIPLSQSSMKQQYCFFTDSTWTQYSKTYRFILSKLTNNYSKKPYLYPRTYDFFDVPGTRTNINAAFTERTIPHIHSIYLVHQDTLNAFQNLIDDKFYSVVSHDSNIDFIASIHAEPITHDLPRAVAYCSKFYDNCYATSMRTDYDLFRQFPITNEEKQLLAKERENLPFQFIPKMLKESNEYMRMRFSNL